MKKTFTVLFILTIIISACGASSSEVPTENMSINTATQSSVISTKIPFTPTFTAIPTVELPVSQLTPVPVSNTTITADNLKNLQEIARYYGEINYFAKVTKDHKFLFILDQDGLTKYAYSSMEQLVFISLPNQLSSFQISNDGRLLLIDNYYFVDFKSDNEPEVYVLPEKIHLLNFYSREFALSPDGEVIAVEQVNCKNLCEHIFRLISTKNFEEIFTSSAQTHQSLPTFSSDGQFFALADLTQVATSGGGTERAGGTVGIWTTKDFIKVSSFAVNFPFDVTGMAFSEDNNLLIIAQVNSIDVIDIRTGESKVRIDDMCESYYRKVMFIPSSATSILERSDCNSGEWIISGDTVQLSKTDIPNLNRIAFDENRNFTEILYPYPTNSKPRPYRSQYYFEFIENNTLSFKNLDLETLDKHSCNLDLSSNSLDCQSYNNLEKDIILATDEKYYSYSVTNNNLAIFSHENPNQISYSIQLRDSYFDLLVLDTINNLIIYNGLGRAIIQDIESSDILEKWEGETFLSTIAISKNKKITALCFTIGYTNRPDKDKLVIFDMVEKKTTYSTKFTCSGTSLALSSDGTKLAAEHSYLRNPSDEFYSTKTSILSTISPYEKNHIEFESFLAPYYVTFSPDDAILAIGCGIEICFFDTLTLNEIYRLRTHYKNTNLAFSPDGSALATSSDWGLISLWAVPPFLP